MDFNAKPTTAFNATDSSVSSLTSFMQLNMNAYTGDGPIDRLPSEMMQMIMAKLAPDGDLNKLIRLRLVSTKWRAVIEDYCGQRKSLFMVIGPCLNWADEVLFNDIAAYYQHVKGKFFGFGKSKDFALLVLIPQFTSTFLSSLLDIFPDTVQLSILCYAHAQATDFATYINSLASLKQLDLYGPFVPDLFSESATLSQLDHLSIYSRICSKSSVQLIGQLGPSCTRFKFDFFEQSDSVNLFRWHSINRIWLANLTHLAIQLYEITREEFDRIVPYISEHATLLKHLSLKAWGNIFKLSPALIDNLAKLTHLSELGLWNITFNVSELENAAAQHRLTPLSSVLTCKLAVCAFDVPSMLTAAQFTRGLSIIFPKMAELDLTIYPVYLSFRTFSTHFRNDVEQHLNRFRNLRKLKIAVK